MTKEKGVSSPGGIERLKVVLRCCVRFGRKVFVTQEAITCRIAL